MPENTSINDSGCDSEIKITCDLLKNYDKSLIEQSRIDSDKSNVKKLDVPNNIRIIEPAYINPELAYITNPINIWLNHQHEPKQLNQTSQLLASSSSSCRVTTLFPSIV